MPTLPCPACGEPTPRLIETLSAIARVNYYRCEQCGHVWNVPKDNPYAPPTPVTQVEPPKSE